jgi:hypothetical protein
VSTLLWIMAVYFLVDLTATVVWAAQRKFIPMVVGYAVLRFLLYGAFIIVCVLAATRGVTP